MYEYLILMEAQCNEWNMDTNFLCSGHVSSTRMVIKSNFSLGRYTCTQGIDKPAYMCTYVFRITQYCVIIIIIVYTNTYIHTQAHMCPIIHPLDLGPPENHVLWLQGTGWRFSAYSSRLPHQSSKRVNGSAVETLFSQLKHTAGGHLSEANYEAAKATLLTQRQTKGKEQYYHSTSLYNAVKTSKEKSNYFHWNLTTFPQHTLLTYLSPILASTPFSCVHDNLIVDRKKSLHLAL